MAHRRLPDFVLMAAVAALIVVAAVDAVRPHRHHRPTQELVARPPARAHASPRSAGSAPAAPLQVALRGSPETAFLPDCRRGRIVLSVESGGPQLVLRRSGGRCHLPALRFEATVRARNGAILYHGPALARDGLEAANLVGPAEVAAPLLPGLLRCDVQAPLRIVVRGGGLAAAGAIWCRGSL